MLSFKFLVDVLHNSELAHKAISVPVFPVFPWESEQNFSAMMIIKTKSQNCLYAPGHDFRYVVSSVKPNFEQQVAKKQLQLLN